MSRFLLSLRLARIAPYTPPRLRKCWVDTIVVEEKMKEEVQRYEWEYIGNCSDGVPFELSGINLWSIKWNSTGEKVDIMDPIYNRKYRFPVYTFINKFGEEIRFAAGEFSNCNWGFYEYVDRSKVKERYERENK